MNKSHDYLHASDNISLCHNSYSSLGLPNPRQVQKRNTKKSCNQLHTAAGFKHIKEKTFKNLGVKKIEQIFGLEALFTPAAENLLNLLLVGLLVS